jgi:hypothetical protein
MDDGHGDDGEAQPFMDGEAGARHHQDDECHQKDGVEYEKKPQSLQSLSNKTNRHESDLIREAVWSFVKQYKNSPDQIMKTY